MQVVAPVRIDGPLVGDKRGELPGLVVLFRGIHGFFPRGFHPLGIHYRFGQFPLRLHHDQFAFGGRRFFFIARIERFVPALQHWIGHHLRITGNQLVDHAHAIGVVGDHEPIIGTAEFRVHTTVGLNFFPQGKSVGIFRCKNGAIHTRICRPPGMHMGIAKIGLGWVRSICRLRRWCSPGRLRLLYGWRLAGGFGYRAIGCAIFLLNQGLAFSAGRFARFLLFSIVIATTGRQCHCRHQNR